MQFGLKVTNCSVNIVAKWDQLNDDSSTHAHLVRLPRAWRQWYLPHSEQTLLLAQSRLNEGVEAPDEPEGGCCQMQKVLQFSFTFYSALSS